MASFLYNHLGYWTHMLCQIPMDNVSESMLSNMIENISFLTIHMLFHNYP